MSYTSCVMYAVRKEDEQNFLKAVTQLARNTRMEPGCLEYRFHRDAQDSQKFFLYELYADEQAYLTHQASGHFGKWAKTVIPPLLENRRIERYIPFEPDGAEP